MRVLVVAALRDGVLAADLLVDGGRAQEVRVPRELARDPAAAAAEVGLRQPARPAHCSLAASGSACTRYFATRPAICSACAIP